MMSLSGNTLSQKKLGGFLGFFMEENQSWLWMSQHGRTSPQLLHHVAVWVLHDKGMNKQMSRMKVVLCTQMPKKSEILRMTNNLLLYRCGIKGTLKKLGNLAFFFLCGQKSLWMFFYVSAC